MNKVPDVSLKPYTTFGFEAYCAQLIEVQTTEQIQQLVEEGFFQHPYRIISGGSNILLTKDLQEPVLLNRIKGMRKLKETQEHAYWQFGAGESWHESVLFAVNSGLGGMENMSLIPGCMGAAPIQNIGAYGVELKDVFDHLQAINLTTGHLETFQRNDCRFGYRDSIFKQEYKNRYFIVNVCLRLDKVPTIRTHYGDISQTLDQMGISTPSISDVSKAVIHIRQSKLPDPAQIGNAGSFFKNPVIPADQAIKLQTAYPDLKCFPQNEIETKIPAAWLIEKAGWKGFRRGNIGVHEKQALVLVHYGNGFGSEVWQLAQEIQKDVRQKFEISLEFEVNIW